RRSRGGGGQSQSGHGFRRRRAEARARRPPARQAQTAALGGGAEGDAHRQRLPRLTALDRHAIVPASARFRAAAVPASRKTEGRVTVTRLENDRWSREKRPLGCPKAQAPSRDANAQNYAHSSPLR